ncbi:MAG: hypothetical protein NVS4B1_15650 [Ktedonobacteraceae bacterium]
MRYRNRNRYRSPIRRFGGLIILVIIMLAIFSGRGFGSDFFLPLLMVVLAFVTLIGSFFTLNLRRIYGGLIGFVWFLGLALCFAIGSFWPWILLPIAVSMLLGILARPLIAALLGLGIFTALNMNQPRQPMYTPPMQPYQPPVQLYQPPQPQSYQSYGEGYQPPVEQPPLYQAGGTQYQQYPSTHSQAYEQPQSQYPQQELPPQQ